MNFTRRVSIGAVCLMFLFGGCAHAQQAIQPLCEGDTYTSRSQQLKEIYTDDQKDREDFLHWTEKRGIEMLLRDRERRLKVAEIFTLGCLKSADDYLYAATVFQHGEVPDHFFQTYIWSMKAFNLGKQEAGIMAGNGVDRYLMNLGYKQLFGGQAVTEETMADLDKKCFCLWPIEESFPEKERRRVHFKTRKELLTWIAEMNKDRPSCSNTICKKEAKPVPRGLIPGLW